MARKPNYGFEKRKKELDRQAKKDAKLRRKQENASERAEETPAGSEDENTGTPASE